MDREDRIAYYRGLCARLCSLRRQRGVSVRELALRSEVSESSIRRLERGEVSARLTLEQIFRLREALGVDPSDFFSG